LTIYPKCLTTGFVQPQQEIAYYSFENRGLVPILATEPGYLVWAKQTNPLLFPPNKNYQLSAKIVKSKT